MTPHEIAKQNDDFRKRVIFERQKDGIAMATRTLIDELTVEQQLDAFLLVRDFNDFNEDNDPNGTHEFGSFKLGNHDIMWQIDCFKDEKCESGLSADSKDIGYRVITVCFLHERQEILPWKAQTTSECSNSALSESHPIPSKQKPLFKSKMLS